MQSLPASAGATTAEAAATTAEPATAKASSGKSATAKATPQPPSAGIVTSGAEIMPATTGKKS